MGFWKTLFRRQAVERRDDPLTKHIDAARDRLAKAQSDFDQVVVEVLDRNESLRGKKASKPHS